MHCHADANCSWQITRSYSILTVIILIIGVNKVMPLKSGYLILIIYEDIITDHDGYTKRIVYNIRLHSMDKF